MRNALHAGVRLIFYEDLQPLESAFDLIGEEEQRRLIKARRPRYQPEADHVMCSLVVLSIALPVIELVNVDVVSRVLSGDHPRVAARKSLDHLFGDWFRGC